MPLELDTASYSLTKNGKLKKKLCTVYCQLNWLLRLKTSLFHVVHNKIIIISNNCLNIFTSAEREVKDSRRSGISVSKLTFFDKIRHAKSVDFRFYSAIWRSESRISSRYPEITSISLIYSNLFEEERMIMLAFPGFEPTHLCDPSDQRRL